MGKSGNGKGAGGPGIAIGIIGTGRGAAEFIAGLAAQTAGNSEAAAAADPIGIECDMRGAHGRAWQFDPKNGAPAIEAAWLIEAPHAHPAWHSYLLLVGSLAPIAGAQPPKLYLPDATHELWLFALNPDRQRASLLDGSDVIFSHVLTPINFAAQLTAFDAEAIKATVCDVVEGRLSPDTDHVRAWAERFGDNMMRKG